MLILTTFENDQHVARALRAGASGFLGKGVSPQELLDAINVVSAGEMLLSPVATRSLILRFLAEPESGAMQEHLWRLQALTPREREVLVLVAQGKSNQDIADELVLSPVTAKTHVNRAMTKLGARDRAQLVIFAYEAGLVRPGWGTGEGSQ